MTKWKTPARPIKRTYPEFWDDLRRKPGAWAQYPGPNRNTTQIKRRVVAGGHYEAVQEDGEMFVRFVLDPWQKKGKR